jgi:hypothetical protein
MSRSKTHQRDHDSRAQRAEVRIADYDSTVTAAAALGLLDTLGIMDLITNISHRESGIDQISILQASKASLLAALNPHATANAGPISFANIGLVSYMRHSIDSYIAMCLFSCSVSER